MTNAHKVIDLDKLIEFVKFTHKIRSVQRQMLFIDENRHENDAEHGYQMALVAWFLIDEDNLKLDKFKAAAMAMVHDVAEVYAGDIIFSASEGDLAEQAKREKEAIARLKKEWPSFKSMHELIAEYEGLKSEEAKFIYALDKFLPLVNHYLYDAKAYKKHGISFDDVVRTKTEKVKLSPEVYKYYEQIMKIFEQHPEFFEAKK
jgi:putative hydrolase of HD superfamily